MEHLLRILRSHYLLRASRQVVQVLCQALLLVPILEWMPMPARSSVPMYSQCQVSEPVFFMNCVD
jgi:hypothetical protein